jgi:hypothetical protein
LQHDKEGDGEEEHDHQKKEKLDEKVLESIYKFTPEYMSEV